MEFIASSSTANQKKMVTLKTVDGHEFVIDHEVAKQSKTLNLMIDVDCTDSVIPLSNITGNVMAVIVDFCKKSLDFQLADADAAAAAAADGGKMKAWEAEFINNVDSTLFYDLILAANYLEIKSLLDVSCQKVANSIKDKTTEEIRNIFNIKNDFTPEEEERIRNENQWAFA